MSDKSLIEWTDATWNPVTGCSVQSKECTNCYAMRLAGTRLRNHPSRAGLTRMTAAGPVWTGETRFNTEWLDQPLRWRRPRRIFVCAHGDLFHPAVPDAWIDAVFGVMAWAHRHTFQVLTKQAQRMRDYLSQDRRRQWAEAAVYRVGSDDADGLYDSIAENAPYPLPNVQLGASTGYQAAADARVMDLLATPAAARFISAEPLLEAVDVGWALSRNLAEIAAGFLRRGRFSPPGELLRSLDWVIVGGESGNDARPMHPDWVRSLRDQCARAGVPFMFKQWGEHLPADHDGCDPGIEDSRLVWSDGQPWSPADGQRAGVVLMARVGKTTAGRQLDGCTHNEFPEVA